MFSSGRTAGPNEASPSSQRSLASPSPPSSSTRSARAAPPSLDARFGPALLISCPVAPQAGALVHIYTDGSVLLTHGGTEMGQGLHTKMVQVPPSLRGPGPDPGGGLPGDARPIVVVSPGCQSSPGHPLFKDSHFGDEHQHGPQHQPHRRLRLLRPERRRRAEGLRGPRQASSAVQEPEPQRIVGGLGGRRAQVVWWQENALKPAVLVFQVKGAYLDRVNLSANGFYK